MKSLWRKFFPEKEIVTNNWTASGDYLPVDKFFNVKLQGRKVGKK